MHFGEVERPRLRFGLVWMTSLTLRVGIGDENYADGYWRGADG
jgi:hypothetical protein